MRFPGKKTSLLCLSWEFKQYIHTKLNWASIPLWLRKKSRQVEKNVKKIDFHLGFWGRISHHNSLYKFEYFVPEMCRFLFEFRQGSNLNSSSLHSWDSTARVPFYILAPLGWIKQLIVMSGLWRRCWYTPRWGRKLRNSTQLPLNLVFATQTINILLNNIKRKVCDCIKIYLLLGNAKSFCHCH